jgi:hypothetical protein
MPGRKPFSGPVVKSGCNERSIYILETHDAKLATILRKTRREIFNCKEKDWAMCGALEETRETSRLQYF